MQRQLAAARGRLSPTQAKTIVIVFPLPAKRCSDGRLQLDRFSTKLKPSLSSPRKRRESGDPGAAARRVANTLKRTSC